MTTRPNFIVLQGEDTGLHHHCYGTDCARTPHLDGLASRGVRFTSAISTAPVSSPSRSSMITGRYPWAIGTHHHRSNLIKPPRLYTHELRDAGYFVNWANKTDFNFEPPDDFADARSDWLEDLRHGALPRQPFLLYHNFGVTHESTMWRWQKQWGAYLERVRGHARLAGKHFTPDEVPVPAYLPDTPEVRGDIARYFDALSIQDAQIGDVLAALDASPYRDNTYVIYLSDHGRGLMREKRWCYEAGLHMPLMVTGPGIEAGAVRDELVSWVDLAPTILRLAGVDVPERYDGQVVLGPDAAPPREYACSGRGRMDETYDYVRSVRDRRFRYVKNYEPQLPYQQVNIYEWFQLTTQTVLELHETGRLSGPPAQWMSDTKPEEELYDVTVDPDNVHNLADDPAYAADLQRMREALESHLATVGDLGAVPERELIERGLVSDVLVDMDKRRDRVPSNYPFASFKRCAMEMGERVG